MLVAIQAPTVLWTLRAKSPETPRRLCRAAAPLGAGLRERTREGGAAAAMAAPAAWGIEMARFGMSRFEIQGVGRHGLGWQGLGWQGLRWQGLRLQGLGLSVTPFQTRVPNITLNIQSTSKMRRTCLFFTVCNSGPKSP